MHDSERLSFLKEQYIPHLHLKELIAVCDSVDNAFALLDTQFEDKTAELRFIKRKICELPMLSPNYDFEHQLKVLKKILKYITIFNRLFSPQEDFHIPELDGSMLSWIPRAQTQTTLKMYQRIMTDKLVQKGTPRSISYHEIIIL